MRTLKNIRHFEKLVVRSMEWSMSPAHLARFFKNLKNMDEELEQIDYTKGRPKISQYEGYIVYEYKRKPKIYFNPYRQQVRVSSEDYKKNKIACHNQAFFLLETLHHLGYITVKFGKFRMRRDLTEKQMVRARKLIEKRFKPERKIQWVGDKE